jgi:hypothetical protein
MLHSGANGSAGTSWTWSSTSSTRRSTTTSLTHSKCVIYVWPRSEQVNIHELTDLASVETNMKICTADSSFVSVIHLLVGVVYCLISWAVGLPKRAVKKLLPYHRVVFYLRFHTAVKIVLGWYELWNWDYSNKGFVNIINSVWLIGLLKFHS